MVGVIVVGSRGDDHVRTPLPYLSNDLKTDLQTRYQFSVVVVEYIVGHAQPFTGLLGLGKTALCQYASSLQLMTGIAVGDRYKFNRMAHSSEESGCSSGIQVTIIGMGTDNDDAKRRCILKNMILSNQLLPFLQYLEYFPEFPAYGLRNPVLIVYAYFI